MPFPFTPILDDFNRANNADLGANWTPIFNTIAVNSNQAVGGSASTNFEYWNVTQFEDSEVYATIVTVPVSTAGFSLAVRLKDVGSVATVDGYAAAFVKAAGADTIDIRRITNGSPTVLTSISQEFANGDTIGFRAVGNVLTVYLNGTAVLSTTDSTYTVGYLGLTMDTTTARVDNFGGGYAPVEPSGIVAYGDVDNPTVTLGSISITPNNLDAYGLTQNPDITLGSITLNPNNINAYSKTDGTIVTLGSLTITPDGIEAFSLTENPNVALGSITLNPSGLIAYGKTEQPTLTLGSIIVIPVTAVAYGLTNEIPDSEIVRGYVVINLARSNKLSMQFIQLNTELEIIPNIINLEFE